MLYTQLSADQLGQLDIEIKQHISNINSQLAERRASWMTYMEQYKAHVDNPNKDFPWPNCSNIFVPELTNAVTTLVSYALSGMFDNSRPPYRVRAYFKKDQETIAELERFVDYYVKVIQQMQHYWGRHLPYTILLGTHIAKMEMRFEPATGYPVVRPYGVPLLQFYTYPTILDLRASPFVSDVRYLPNWELLRWAQKAQKGSYDMKKVEDVYRTVQDFWDHANQYNASPTLASNRVPPNFCPIFDIFMITTLGEKRSEPYKLRVTYEGITETVVGCQAFTDNEVPYVPVFWRRDEDNFFGIGAGELAWRLQKGINTMFNQGIDAGTISNIKMFRVSRGSNIDPEEPIYPGRQVIADQGEFEAIALGDVTPGLYNLLGMMKMSLENTLASPPAFRGQPDTVAKSGVTPGVLNTQVQQSAGRLETFLSEFETGCVDIMWYTLAALAKGAAQYRFALPDNTIHTTLLEWLQTSPEAGSEDVLSVIEARVEPEMVGEVQDMFLVEEDLYSRKRFELRPIRKELDAQQEQQAALLLSQLTNAYISKIMEFAGTLQQLQQQPGETNKLQAALLEAWKTTNFVMRRVLSAFAVEDASEIIMQLEEVVSGLEAGIPQLPSPIGPGGGMEQAAAMGGGPVQGEPSLAGIDLGNGAAGFAGAAQGVLGGRPEDAVAGATEPFD